MRCVRRQRLFDYLNGELSRGERADVDSHLSSCEKCRKTLRELEERVRSVKQAVSKMDPWALPDVSLPGFEMEEPASAAGRSKVRAPMGPSWRLRTVPWAAFSGAALMMLAAILILWPRKDVIENRAGFDFQSFHLESVFLTDAKEDWDEKRLYLTIYDEETGQMEIIKTSLNEDNITREVVPVRAAVRSEINKGGS